MKNVLREKIRKEGKEKGRGGGREEERGRKERKREEGEQDRLVQSPFTVDQT